MMTTMNISNILRTGDEIQIDPSMEHLTFTDVKISGVKLSGDSLSMTVESLRMFKPYPQTNPDRDGTTIKRGTFVFSGVISSDREIAALRDDWRQQKGQDRFESPIKESDLSVSDIKEVALFDIGAGYLLRDGKEYEIRSWTVAAVKLVFIPDELS